ncbi:MAG: S8 family serine peptidase, partial [Bacteroidota bacterium]
MRTIILALIIPFFLLPLLLFGQSGAKHTLVPKDVDLQTKIQLAQEQPGLQAKMDMADVEKLRQELLASYELHWYAIELEHDAEYWSNVETDKLLIEFEDGYGLNSSNIAAFLEQEGIDEVLFKSRYPRIQNWAQLACTDCTPSDVTAIAKAAQKVNGIKVLEPTPVYELHNCEPDDQFYGDQWGPEAIRIDSLWCYYTGGGVPWLAVLDDAIDLEHEDHGNWYEYYDHAMDDTNPRPDTPEASHGTHVGGTSSAILNNGIGVSGMVNDSAYFGKLGDLNDDLSSAGIID